MLLVESSRFATNLILKLNCYYKNSVCLWCTWLDPLGMCWHAIEKKPISPWEGQEWQIDGDRSVQFSSVTQSCPMFCDPMDYSTPGFPIHHQLPELAQTHVHWVNDDVQPSYLVILFSCLQSFPASGSFSMCQHFQTGGQKKKKGGQSIETSSSASVLPMNIHRLICFKINWFDLAVQGALKSLLQHHSSKASVLQCSAFFMAQLSYPNMTTGKTIALTKRPLLVMSLLLNMLSRLVISFLPRSKHLLISWLQSPSAVILEPPKIKSLTVSIVSPSICHEVMGLDAMILVFWMLSFKPAFLLSSFTFKRLFSFSLSAIRVVSSVYLRLLIFLPAILFPAYASSSSAFHMMYSAYKLNK